MEGWEPGWDDYDPEPCLDFDPEPYLDYDPEPCQDYEPDDDDVREMHHTHRLACLAAATTDDFLDPSSDVSVLLANFGFGPESDEELLARAAARFMRDRRLARTRPLPWSAELAWVLALLKAEQPGTPAPVLLAADHRPADDLAPTMAGLRAHATLTAAPPRSRAPVHAGAAA